MYDLSKMSFGAELEVGDVSREIPIPAHLGKWALTETDVVNIHADRRGVACDPLGLDPIWGGEVNMLPQPSVNEAYLTMKGILDFLAEVPGNIPSYTSLNASHVHVHVPGLREDVDALKRLQDYVIRSQEFFLEHSYMKDYTPPKWTKQSKKAHTVPLDGNRKMQPWMNENIQKMAKTPEDFFNIQLKGKDGVTNYRIFRYCVNTYNLRLINTVEFRWFRATLDPTIWHNMFHFCQRFMVEALERDTPIEDWMFDYQYPPFIEHDLEMLQSWERTKYTQDRFLADHPRRTFVEL